MAYGEQFYHQFCDPYNDTYRIAIQKIDYVGSTTELEAQEVPIIISYSNQDDNKFETIIKSTAEINLTFGTGNGVDFDAFGQADERTYKIVYTKNGAVEWTGFVLPDGFAYDFVGGIYYAKIKANDGLETLEGILFKDNNTNEPYGLTDLTYNNEFEFPFVLIATEILRKLDLDLDTWTLCDVYEKNMVDLDSDSRNSDPMAISYVNVRTYINDSKRNDIPYFEDAGEVWNCLKVMKNLLEIWSCKLYQEEGAWKIKRVTVDAKYGFIYPENLGSEYFYRASYNDTAATIITDTIFYENKDLYSVDAVLIVGSYCTNVSGGPKADEGYYKLVGIDKIVHIDSIGEVDSVTVFTHPTYYWHKYNTLAGYIGREEISDDITIPCNGLIETDHVISWDKVYQQFRVNYEYSFIKQGDKPVNLIKNGDFAESYDQYGELESPPEWERWRAGNKWYPRLRTETLTGADITDSGGYNYAVRFGQQYNDLNTKNTDPNPAVWADLRQTFELDSTVKSMQLSFWCKFKYVSTNKKVSYYPVLKCFFIEERKYGTPKIYTLVNDVYGKKLKWKETESNDGFDSISIPGGSVDFYYPNPFFRTSASLTEQYDEAERDQYKWYNFKYDVEAPPSAGQCIFTINGICATSGRTSSSFQPFPVIVYKSNSDTGSVKTFPTVRKDWVDQGGDIPRPMFTGIEFGYIPDPDQEVPANDYVYANDDIDYTYQDEPIEVFNGDTESPEIQSSIIVPLNVTGAKNKWDTADKDYGYTDIGMISCKTIMSQYGAPSRLFEGILKEQGMKYGSRFTLEALPNVIFVLLRGSFNHKKGYLQNATLAQISVDSLASGGQINGQSLDPIWVETGNIRCVKDVNQENTGDVEIEEIDSNYNSETYGDLRWVDVGTDITTCPIGQPSKYFWGTDDAGYSVGNFTDYTVFLDEGGVVQVKYNNVGGKYIFFLHLSTLGTVNRVANDFQYNIISSFQYLPDVTINGYLYRVLRQDFVTSEFEDFSLTFDFN